MSDQSNAAAERSAHVIRGGHEAAVWPVLEVEPGVFRLRAVVEAEVARDAALAEVRTLRGLLGDILEPMPGTDLAAAMAAAWAYMTA